jgi:hypothetical protein
MSATPRFRVEKAGNGFILAHGRDPGLVWCHTRWADREEPGERPSSFPGRAAAVKYAREVFAEATTEPDEEKLVNNVSEG